MADALRRVARVDAVLKWPNDVLLDGRKVAGVLAEVVATVPEPAVVVGVGVNVSLRSTELPVAGATSLLLAGAAHTDRATLLRTVLRELDVREAAWRAGRDEAADYRSRCATLGVAVRVELPAGGALTGVATDVDDVGRLLVRTPDGATQALSAGDVVHVRPSGS